jgi:hypothetical protein
MAHHAARVRLEIPFVILNEVKYRAKRQFDIQPDSANPRCIILLDSSLRSE